jgi:hypothetical protein
MRLIICDACGEEIHYSSFYYEIKMRKTSQEREDNIAFISSADEPANVYYFDLHICQKCFNKIFSFETYNRRKLHSGRSIDDILTDMLEREDENGLEEDV